MMEWHENNFVGVTCIVRKAGSHSVDFVNPSLITTIFYFPRRRKCCIFACENSQSLMKTNYAPSDRVAGSDKRSQIPHRTQ